MASEDNLNSHFNPFMKSLKDTSHISINRLRLYPSPETLSIFFKAVYVTMIGKNFGIHGDGARLPENKFLTIKNWKY